MLATEIMTENPVTAKEDMTAEEAMRLDAVCMAVSHLNALSVCMTLCISCGPLWRGPGLYQHTPESRSVRNPIGTIAVALQPGA